MSRSEFDASRALAASAELAVESDPLEVTHLMTVAERRQRQTEARMMHAVAVDGERLPDFRDDRCRCAPWCTGCN